MLNKLLKTSLILLLAITLTACTGGKKKKTPGTDEDGTDNIDTGKEISYNDFCDQNPQLVSDQKYICYYIKDKTEMDRNKAKPLYKHKINSDDKSPTTIRWDDKSFGKEFLPFTIVDASTGGGRFYTTFSIDKDSILDNETEYKYLIVSPEGNIIDKMEYNKTYKVGQKETYGWSGFGKNIGKKGVFVALFTSTPHADKYLPFAFIDFQ